MTRTTNRGVIRAWVRGEPARSSTGNLTTDGRTLWSYRLAIGTTDDNGASVALDYTRGGGAYISQTTSCHVGLARRSADCVARP